MTELLRATISAGTLTRIFSELNQIGNQAVFDISPTAAVCHILDASKAHQLSVTIPSEACETYIAGSGRIGIDTSWILQILNCTPDGATVIIVIDNEIHLNIGMHGISSKLEDIDRMRKPPKNPIISHTVSMNITGEIFKAMIEYNEAICADALEIHANQVNVSFRSWHNFELHRYYDLEADCLTEYLEDAQGLYSTDYLVDIAAEIHPAATVSLRLGSNMPIEIEYTVDGCEIKHILAPRIERD